MKKFKFDVFNNGMVVRYKDVRELLCFFTD